MTKKVQPADEANDMAQTKDLSVKGIPEQVWIKARYNAMQSRMSFRDYLVRILENCQVFQVDAADP